jgi:hypothetical protein
MRGLVPNPSSEPEPIADPGYYSGDAERAAGQDPDHSVSRSARLLKDPVRACPRGRSCRGHGGPAAQRMPSRSPRGSLLHFHFRERYSYRRTRRNCVPARMEIEPGPDTFAYGYDRGVGRVQPIRVPGSMRRAKAERWPKFGCTSIGGDVVDWLGNGDRRQSNPSRTPGVVTIARATVPGMSGPAASERADSSLERFG